MNHQESRRILQLAVLGDGLVGKTALLRRYKGLPFNHQYRMTVGADFVIKRIKRDQIDLTLQIWDVGGQPQFKKLRSRYYANTDAVVIVFDLTRRPTYNGIPNWLEEVLRINDWKFVPLLLVGNKEDLTDEQEAEINDEEIQEYVKTLEEWGKSFDPSFQVIYMETSAKTGRNVEESFSQLLNIVINGN